MSIIQEQLQGLATLCSGKQKMFYERQLKDMKQIEISPMSEVLTKEQISRVKKLRPKKKECWKNALIVARELGCEYVEGLLGMQIGLAIDHAFNKIGDKYFDPTVELALNRDVAADNDDYVMFIAMPYKDAAERVIERGEYGEIYKRQLFKEIDD